ncbi:hypothetical protein [uncultured Clostridium sp.]|uniref:hypothetical protein n=1 Tax=uncultured Clostridium sp. TaxID=59620 RepID=UPI002603BE77|nr:hypothetical protein [uncultured Clostridium sp.]
MIEFLKFLVDFMNQIHHKAVDVLGSNGYGFSDKQLHFIFIGCLGIMIFIFSHFLFKVIAKYSLTAVSFIYTFTILIFITVAIEIQQKLTGQGQAEFGDVFWGLYGFVYVFFIYIAIRLLLLGVQYLFKKFKSKKAPGKRYAKKRKPPEEAYYN